MAIKTITSDLRLANKPNLTLKYSSVTGIAWIEDASTGMAHSAHPNISTTGSLRIYRKKFGLGKCKFKRCRGFWYNTSHCAVSTAEDRIAASYCQCGGNHGDILPVGDGN